MLPLLASLLALPTVAEPKPLDRMVEALRGHKAVSFTMIGGLYDRSERAEVRLRAPGSFAIVGEDFTMRSDGVKALSINPAEKTWRTLPIGDALKSVQQLPGFGLVFPGAPKPYAAGPIRDEELAGERVIAVPIDKPKDAPNGYALQLLLDPKTWLPRGFKSFRDDKPYETFRFEDVVLSPSFKPNDFQVTIPKGFKKADS